MLRRSQDLQSECGCVFAATDIELTVYSRVHAASFNVISLLSGVSKRYYFGRGRGNFGVSVLGVGVRNKSGHSGWCCFTIMYFAGRYEWLFDSVEHCLSRREMMELCRCANKKTSATILSRLASRCRFFLVTRLFERNILMGHTLFLAAICFERKFWHCFVRLSSLLVSTCPPSFNVNYLCMAFFFFCFVGK